LAPSPYSSGSIGRGPGNQQGRQSKGPFERDRTGPWDGGCASGPTALEAFGSAKRVGRIGKDDVRRICIVGARHAAPGGADRRTSKTGLVPAGPCQGPADPTAGPAIPRSSPETKAPGGLLKFQGGCVTLAAWLRHASDPDGSHPLGSLALEPGRHEGLVTGLSPTDIVGAARAARMANGPKPWE